MNQLINRTYIPEEHPSIINHLTIILIDATKKDIVESQTMRRSVSDFFYILPVGDINLKPIVTIVLVR